MADNVTLRDKGGRLYTNATLYTRGEDLAPSAWVECDYCKRAQERPKQGQCCGCGAPIRLK